MNTAVVMASTTRASGLLFRRATLHQLRQRGISRSTTTTTTTQRALQPNRPPGSTTTTKRWQQARAKPKNFSSDTHGSTTTAAINTCTGDSMLTPIACVLLAVTLTYSSSESLPAEAGWWPFSNGGGWWRGGRKSSSPFDNTVPRRAKKQRAKAEVNMRAYLAKMRGPVQELVAGLREGKVSREDFDRRMAIFNNEVELATHRIIFGEAGPPDARRRYEAEYGNCRYTPEAIQTVAALSPLVEIEAGRGHWQRALSAAGATVVSFDRWAGGISGSDVPPEIAPVGKVLPGDERALRQHRDKALLLVHPAPGDMALRCLREFRGDTFVYVGEGRGGANANDDFFDGLDAEWEASSILELDPFPQCFERLFILRRKKLAVSESLDGQKNTQPAASSGGRAPGARVAPST
eukprot:jgi/Undpi1/11098/HiC_scaffold_30.g13396.m1